MYIVHFKHKNDDKSGKGKEVREYKVKGGYSLKKISRKYCLQYVTYHKL